VHSPATQDPVCISIEKGCVIRRAFGPTTRRRRVCRSQVTFPCSRLTGEVERSWAGSQRMLGHLSGLPVTRQFDLVLINTRRLLRTDP
jgi:hypothetical protein